VFSVEERKEEKIRVFVLNVVMFLSKIKYKKKKSWLKDFLNSRESLFKFLINSTMSVRREMKIEFFFSTGSTKKKYKIFARMEKYAEQFMNYSHATRY
jgi:hypothetical protein